MDEGELYQTPLVSRYASQEMSRLFSQIHRAKNWRKIWIAVARAQQELGLPISPEQLRELEAHADDIDLKAVARYEKELRHDVMAHIRAYGDQCPQAKGILHLGLTSASITDNADLLAMREALHLVQSKIITLLKQMERLAKQYRALPCLAYTHFQPAQLTTVGKRLCLWMQDFLLDANELIFRLEQLKFLGIKGAVGTQASLLQLFNEDQAKVALFEERVAKLMGFSHFLTISGQTYTRKQDMQLLDCLAGIAVSAHKFATDVRLLAHLKEFEEPWESAQVGSSAMAHKRNPMRCERVCALARFAISLSENPRYTAALQWFERTLDDSANRRLVIPEAFLCVDAILNLLLSITGGLKLHPKIIERHVQEELPFLATESFLVDAVRRGKDRQVVHELLMRHSQKAGEKRAEGEEGDFLERIVQDKSLGFTKESLRELMDVKQFMGCACEQVDQFLQEEIHSLLNKYGHLAHAKVSVTV